jgi:hypothetical protein
MEQAANSNLEKLKYIVAHDSNYNLTQNTLQINLKNTIVNIDIARISNVRIKKTRSLVINYLIIISIVAAYLLIDKLLFFDIIFHFALNVVTGLGIYSAFFVSKCSYRLVINNEDFSYINLKLSKHKFDKWSSFLR